MSPAKTALRTAHAPGRASAAPGAERQLVPGASWDFYDRLTNALGERSPFRIAYDGRDVEITTIGPKHERSKGLLGTFIEYVSTGLEIKCEELGSTTWKRPELERGIEADLCYCFDHVKRQAIEAADERDSNDVADYPDPDLAVEIDLSPSKIDRPGIYSALKVSEVWRLRDGAVSIEQLGAAGRYVKTESSRFLHVRHDEVTRWVVKEKSGNRAIWKKRLAEWVRDELKPRLKSS
jgi:Uma2 family endonuclease